jgi:hypothetical protein
MFMKFAGESPYVQLVIEEGFDQKAPVDMPR